MSCAGVSPPDDFLIYGWTFAQRQELIGWPGFRPQDGFMRLSCTQPQRASHTSATAK
jgi:hypothetical protein